MARTLNQMRPLCLNSVLRFAFPLIAAWLLIGAPANAGSIETRGDETVIHIVSAVPVNPASPSIANQADMAAIRAFQREWPHIFAERYRAKYKANPTKYGTHNWDKISVEIEPFTGIKVEGAEVDLLAIAGGIAPDVLYINFRKSDSYIQNNFLYPLDKPEDGYLSTMTEEEQAFRIHPTLWQVIDRIGPGGQHVWALPYGGALGKVLLYRKDLFDRYKVPHPTVDWTWDDLLAAARALTDPKRGTYGIQLHRGKQESWYWVTYLWSAGGDVMEYNKDTDQWRCVFGSTAGVEALDFYTRLSAERWVDADGVVRRGYSSKDASDFAMKWERGEIGMMMAYIDERLFSTINPELTGMVPVPKGPRGERGGELNSRMMGLFSGITDPAVRDAAWEFMRFYESEAAVRIKTKIMVEGGYGPFVNPRYLHQFGYPEFERLSPPGWAETFEIAIETGRPEPYGRNSNVAYDLMTLPIERAEQLALSDQLPDDPKARAAIFQNLLTKAETRANEIMIGIVPPDQLRIRRATALATLIALLAGFAWVFRKVFATFRPEHSEAELQSRAKKTYGWVWLLLTPALLTILVWQYLPLAQGAGMAFFDYRLLGHSIWVGLDNFGSVLFDNLWWTSIWNSIRYSLLILALTFLPPIALAILLQEVPRGKLLFRLIYYLPAVVTGIVTILLWKQFYEPSERGALNALLLRIPAIGYIVLATLLFGIAMAFARRLWSNDIKGVAITCALVGVILFFTVANIARPLLFIAGEPLIESLRHLLPRLLATQPEPYRWLSDPQTAMLACVIPMIWAGMGPGCLIYLAALKGIADEYYEAAEIDGAGFIDKILFVIFPILKPLIIINFVGAFIGSWYGAEGNILVMTGGAANTEVAGLHIWFKAFTFLQFGPATAMAWMLGFLLIGFTVHQLRILARVEFRTAGEER